ncbi:MAG: STN domain-containing protein, partial [Thermodesulfobacteriota bacterium]
MTSSVSSVVLAVTLSCAATVAGAATVQVKRGDGGLRVAADEARLEDVLDALAEEEGFDVVMQLGIERRPVNVDLRDVTLEEALRRVLRRRNYAIAYEETDDGLAVSRVHVLLPAAAVAASSQSRRSPAVEA